MNIMMSETNSVIFLDSSILCNSTRSFLNTINIHDAGLQAPGYSTMYFKSGLLERIAKGSKVIIIKKASLSKAAWDLINARLYKLDGVLDFTVWQDVNYGQLTEWIDDAVTTRVYGNALGSKEPFRYLYVDSVDYAGIRSLIEDHRMLGVMNAGMIIPSSQALTVTDVNFMQDFWQMHISEMTWLKNDKSNKVSV